MLSVSLQNLFVFVACLGAFVSPLSVAMMNACLILLFLLWLLGGDKKKFFFVIKSSFFVKVCFFYVLFFAMEFLIAGFPKEAVFQVRKLPYFLLIPILMSSFPKIKTHQVIFSFLGGLFFSHLVSYLLIFGFFPDQKWLLGGGGSPFINHSYYSFLLCLGLLFLMNFFVNKKVIFASFNRFLTQERYFQIIIFFLFCSFLINLFIQTGRSGVLIALVLVPVFYLLHTKKIYHSACGLSGTRKTTPLNSDSASALAGQWYELTGLNLWLHSIKSFFMPLLFGLLLLSCMNFIESPMKYRMQKLQNDIIMLYKGKYEELFRTSDRFLMVYFSFKMIETQPFFGVGMGNFKKEYRKLLDQGKYAYADVDHPHNQYLFMATQHGIWSPLILLFLFIAMVIEARQLCFLEKGCSEKEVLSPSQNKVRLRRWLQNYKELAEDGCVYILPGVLFPLAYALMAFLENPLMAMPGLPVFVLFSGVLYSRN